MEQGFGFNLEEVTSHLAVIAVAIVVTLYIVQRRLNKMGGVISDLLDRVDKLDDDEDGVISDLEDRLDWLEDPKLKKITAEVEKSKKEKP